MTRNPQVTEPIRSILNAATPDVRRDGTVADIPDEELLRRAVDTARSREHRKGLGHPRWVAVMGAFMLGSTYASQLCARFGFKPDEQVKR